MGDKMRSPGPSTSSAFRAFAGLTVAAFFAFFAFVAPGCGAQATGPAAVAPPLGSLPGIQPIAPLAAGQWTMPAGDYGNLRYSPLDQITDKNVQNLHVVAIHETGIPHGHEGQPLVVNGTLYMVTPFPNNLIAMDITKPGFPAKWEFDPNPDNRAVGIACCDTVNRGASYADGKIVYNTLDDHTYAVDCCEEYGRRRHQRRRVGQPRQDHCAGSIDRQDQVARVHHRLRQRHDVRS
jgi:glucose dehydrogenase